METVLCTDHHSTSKDNPEGKREEVGYESGDRFREGLKM